jgi:hypothetical protein
MTITARLEALERGARAPAELPDTLIRAVRVDAPPTAGGLLWVKIAMDSGAWQYVPVPPGALLTPNGPV